MAGWAINWERGAADRRDLAEQIQSTLRSHPLVESTELFGSLASREHDGYPADQLSDIDIRVHLNRGSDRRFFEDLAEILGRVRPVLLGNAFVSDGSYIGCYMVETYSPFWKVDVVCSAPSHLPGSDLLEATRHERAFGSWCSALKRFARANEFLGYFLEFAPEAVPSRHYAPKQFFEELLEGWYRQSNDSIRRGIGLEILDHIPLDPVAHT